jgi:hypothetical protein
MPTIIVSTSRFTADESHVIARFDDDAMYKAYCAGFLSVVVDHVVVTANILKLDDYQVRFGLYRSRAAAPASAADLAKVPFLHGVSSDSRTAKSHIVVFRPEGSDVVNDNRLQVGVPALEWDINQTAVRRGWPYVIMGITHGKAGAIPIGSLHVQWHVTLTGTGSGY